MPRRTPTALRGNIAPEDLAADFDAVYPGVFGLSLIRVCTPLTPHEHWDPKTRLQKPCEKLGKRPLGGNWNVEAAERRRHPEQRTEHLLFIAQHFCDGGNVGLAIPEGVIALDLDEAAAFFHFADEEEGALQYSRDTRDRGHALFGWDGVPISATDYQLRDAWQKTLVRADSKSQIVCWPSTHELGDQYDWHRELPGSPDELSLLPAEFAERVKSRRIAGATVGEGAKVPHGHRYPWLVSQCARLRHGGLKNIENEEALGDALWWVFRQDCEGPHGDCEDTIRGLAHDFSDKESAAEADALMARLLNGAESQSCESEEWENPIPLDATLPVEPLQLDALPSPVAEFVRGHSAVTQVSTDFGVAAALGVLSCACVGRAAVAVGHTHTEELALYMMPALGSGERKVSIRDYAAPLMKAEADLEQETREERRRQESICRTHKQRVKSLEDRAAKAKTEALRAQFTKEAADCAALPPKEPKTPRLLGDDLTPEALAVALAQHGSLGIVSEEAGTLFEILTGRYNSGKPVLDVHLKAYDGGQIRVDRVHRDAVLAECPVLGILVTPQPGLIRGLSRDHVALEHRGLLARCCFLFPESLVGFRMYQDREIKPSTRNAWHWLIEKLARRPILGAESPRLRLEGAGLRVWENFHNRLEHEMREGGDLEHMRAWVSKHPGRCARLTAIFHLVRHAGSDAPQATTIDEEDVLQAEVVCDWLLEHARTAHCVLSRTPEALAASDYVAWARRKTLTEFSLRDLHQDFRRRVTSPGEHLAGLQLAEAHGYFRRLSAPARNGKKGRLPSPRWAVNPNLHLQESVHATHILELDDDTEGIS